MHIENVGDYLKKNGIKDDNEIINNNDACEDVFAFFCVFGIAIILAICLIVGAELIYNTLDNRAQLVPADQVMNGNWGIIND